MMSENSNNGIRGERNVHNEGWLQLVRKYRPVTIFIRCYSFIVLLLDIVYFFYYLITTMIKAVFGVFWSPPKKCLANEVAIIVGASRGIGRELAIQLGELGATPICLDRNMAENKALVKLLRDAGIMAYGYTCDVTDVDQVKRTIAFIDREVGNISMYFHCCGLPSPRSIVEEPPTIQETIAVSVVSHFYLLDEVLPKMKRNSNGHIVLFTSVAGLSGIKNQMPLAVSQFAVQGLFESLVEDVRNGHFQDNIQVSLVHIYPFLISENLENDIRLRIPSYFGTLRVEQAATEILDGVRRNQMEMSIPKYYLFLGHILRMFPKKATFLLRELLDTGVDFG